MSLDVITNLVQLGFSVAVAAVLLKFVLNDLSHKLNAIHSTLKELVQIIKERRE